MILNIPKEKCQGPVDPADNWETAIETGFSPILSTLGVPFIQRIDHSCLFLFYMYMASYKLSNSNQYFQPTPTSACNNNQ